MKKVRKGKKMLITMIIAIIAIIVAIVIIVNVVKRKSETPGTDTEEQQQVFELPETKTESGMDVQRISMEYLKDIAPQEYDTLKKEHDTARKAQEKAIKAEKEQKKKGTEDSTGWGAFFDGKNN